MSSGKKYEIIKAFIDPFNDFKNLKLRVDNLFCMHFLHYKFTLNNYKRYESTLHILTKKTIFLKINSIKQKRQ